MRSVDRQRGAVALTVAFALLFLLGFMAFALDFGHMFVVKDELQTSMDACALSAAQELDGAGDAIPRAINAGIAAGNLNNVNFQSATWSGKGKIVATDITFKDASYGTTTVSANAKYAQCSHKQSGIQMWLFQALGAFAGSNDPAYSSTKDVGALAVATLAPAQTNCALPIGVCEKPGGYATGEWIPGAVNQSTGAITGQFRWLDFSPNVPGGGTAELKDILGGTGQCNLPGNNTVAGKPGNNGGAAQAYNTRFGIYQGSADPTINVPDLTGYSWYTDASSITQPPYPNEYPTFLAKRAIFAPYQGDNKIDDPNLKLPGGERTYTGSLATIGGNRRIVIVPIIDCTAFDGLGGSGTIKISNQACVLLLHPISPTGAPGAKMWLEYRGLVSDPGSPCSTMGLAGGTGPQVPVLVQ